MTADAFAAECGVCGSILIDPRCLPEIMDHVTVEDFSLESNRAIFRAAVELEGRGEVVDPVTILHEAGGAVSQDYLRQLMEETPTAANAGVYAAEVRRASMRRALLDLGRTLAEQTGPFADPRAVIAGAQKELERIEAQDTARELATPAEVLLSFQEHREQMDSGTGVSFVPTGFRNLDTLLGGGMLSGGLYLLAARPGMGKTSLALCIADKAAARGPVLFVSLEMDPEQLSAKRLARETGIPSDKLLFGGLTSEEYDRVAQGSVSLSKLSLYLNRRPQATVEDIAALARKVKGLQLLVIDYFGLIQPSEKGRSRYESATEISGRLKALARSLKVPILCLAQLNRENMERRDKRPQLSDLRDTGALEQDADGVMLLHRPDYYEAKGDKLDPWEPTPVEVILAKNRHASTGVCHMIFYLATCRVLQEARAREA